MSSRFFRRSSYILAATALLTLAACGAGTTSDTGGGSGSSYVSWSGNENGTEVLDANGNSYKFDSADGCMYGTHTSVGPSGFCLTPTSSGYAFYGPTNCSNPGSNSLCNTASFTVVLTNEPVSGCMAVLTAGNSSSVTAKALAVTSNGNGFNIQSDTTATAFTVYWNGYVPICGGSNPYQGSYTLAVTGPTFGPSEGCDIDTNVGGTFTIDSGGVINNDKGATGIIKSDGKGDFYVNTFDPIYGGSGVAHITIDSVTKNSSGKWVLSGTNYPFCVGYDANPWTLTQT
jgi:hypothetical protein